MAAILIAQPAESESPPVASYPASTTIRMHSHATENVVIITRGELILTMNGTERRFRPRDWYHVPPKALHAARFDVATSESEFWFRQPSVLS